MNKLLILIFALFGILEEEPSEPFNWLIFGLKVLVMLATLILVAFQDYSKMKEPYDKKHRAFKWKTQWWRWRKDNVIPMWILGFIGFALSGEIGRHLVTKYFSDLGDFTEGTIELTAVFVTTFFFAKYFSKVFGVKDPEPDILS